MLTLTNQSNSKHDKQANRSFGSTLMPQEKITELLDIEKQICLDRDNAITELLSLQSVFGDTAIDSTMRMALNDVAFFVKDLTQQLDDVVYHLSLSCPLIRAQEYIHSGANVFINGKSGTGKSTVIREIMKQEGSSRNDVVVTPTGMTAYNLGKEVKAITCTPYKYAKVGRATSLSKFKQYFCAMKQKWLDLEFIIIKEISMFPGDLLDWLDHYVWKMRADLKGTMLTPVFGGGQVIAEGDFWPAWSYSKANYNYRLEESR